MSAPRYVGVKKPAEHDRKASVTPFANRKAGVLQGET
jgi:hypothetical protein